MWNSKPKKRGCDCRGRTHGNPKTGNGPCYGYNDQRPAVRVRIASKKLVRRWLAAQRLEDVDD